MCVRQRNSSYLQSSLATYWPSIAPDLSVQLSVQSIPIDFAGTHKLPLRFVVGQSTQEGKTEAIKGVGRTIASLADVKEGKREHRCEILNTIAKEIWSFIVGKHVTKAI